MLSLFKKGMNFDHSIFFGENVHFNQYRFLLRQGSYLLRPGLAYFSKCCENNHMCLKAKNKSTRPSCYVIFDPHLELINMPFFILVSFDPYLDIYYCPKMIYDFL